jgi:putative Holliday junction resolvase
VWLAVDPGEVRTGVSASDASGVLASPLTTLEGRDRVQLLADLVTEHEPAGVIIGYPVSLSGNEGKAGKGARRLAEQLAGLVTVPVFLVDERLTTVTAAAQLRASGRNSKSSRAVIDQAAATTLLQAVLDGAASTGCNVGEALDQRLGERVTGAQS